MARLARAEVFGAQAIACVHMISRVVRSCFLLDRGNTLGSATVLIVCNSRIAKIVNLRFPLFES